MSLPYRHVACCIDGSDAATAALQEARAIAETAGATLSVVHVLAPPPFMVSLAAGLGGGGPVGDEGAEREAAEAWLASVAEGAGAQAVLLAGHPPSATCEWAESAGVDLLVAARHRGLVERVVLGSFAGYLSHHAPSAVLLTRPAA